MFTDNCNYKYVASPKLVNSSMSVRVVFMIVVFYKFQFVNYLLINTFFTVFRKQLQGICDYYCDRIIHINPTKIFQYFTTISQQAIVGIFFILLARVVVQPLQFSRKVLKARSTAQLQDGLLPF